MRRVNDLIPNAVVPHGWVEDQFCVDVRLANAYVILNEEGETRVKIVATPDTLEMGVPETSDLCLMLRGEEGANSIDEAGPSLAPIRRGHKVLVLVFQNKEGGRGAIGSARRGRRFRGGSCRTLGNERG